MGANWQRGQLWEHAVTSTASTHTHTAQQGNTHTPACTHTPSPMEWLMDKLENSISPGWPECVYDRGESESGRDGRGIPTGGGGSLRWIISRGSGRRDAAWPVTSNLLLNQPRLHMRARTHTQRSAWGQGRGYFRVRGRGGVVKRQAGVGAVRWDVPFCETRVGFKRALWAAAYRCAAGAVHRTASPLKTEVKVKAGPGRAGSWAERRWSLPSIRNISRFSVPSVTTDQERHGIGRILLCDW